VTPTPTPTETVTPTATETPIPSATTTPDLNHYECYEAHAPVEVIAGVSVEDAFGPSTVDVIEPRRFCAPVDKNGEDPTAPDDPDHLTGYKIKQRTPAVRTHREQTVADQFGTFVVDVTKPEYLLVPSAKSLGGPPAPLAAPAVDHFKCYKIRRGRFSTSGVQIEDQFGTATLDLVRPLRICTAADKNGEGVLDPGANLLCYKVKTVSSSPPGAPGLVFIDNQFGPDSFEIFRRTELCVPATLTLNP
jgi:hypothetical protein